MTDELTDEELSRMKPARDVLKPETFARLTDPDPYEKKARGIDLLPCPFCGPMPAAPELWQDHSGYWRVTCGPCGASSGILPEGERWPNARELVAANWNKRSV